MASNDSDKKIITAAVIGALGAIVAAIIGVSFASSNHANSPIPSTASAPKNSISSAQISGTSISVPPGVSTGKVLRKGQLTLDNNYCADLDSTAPNWSVSSQDAIGCATYGAINGNGDIRELDTDQGLYGPNNVDFAILNSAQSSSYATCDSVTDYSNSIDTKTVVPGLRFCVRTTSGNFALMQVVSAQISPTYSIALGSVTFNVIVWQGNGTT